MQEIGIHNPDHTKPFEDIAALEGQLLSLMDREGRTFHDVQQADLVLESLNKIRVAQGAAALEMDDMLNLVRSKIN